MVQKEDDEITYTGEEVDGISMAASD